MPEISLTEFVDFIIKAGTPKLTVVKDIKRDHVRGYHPSRDYWRKLRDGIVEMHEQGLQAAHLDRLASRVHEPNKRVNYPIMVGAYKKYLGRKKTTWFVPPQATWAFGDLHVRINPELGLEINGQPHLIKLYFKSDALTQRKIEIINHLIIDALGDEVDGATVGLLDVRNSHFLDAKPFDASLAPLLQGEALNFSTIYKSI